MLQRVRLSAARELDPWADPRGVRVSCWCCSHAVTMERALSRVCFLTSSKMCVITDCIYSSQKLRASLACMRQPAFPSQHRQAWGEVTPPVVLRVVLKFLPVLVRCFK